MNDLKLFFGKFLRHGTKIASIAPSGKRLSRLATERIDWVNARSIVELGAGTGPITQVIVERAHPDCRLWIWENDPDFARLLRERFQTRPNLNVIEGDACDLDSFLKAQGENQIDAVISGLPVPSFSPGAQNRLFQAIGRVLSAEGWFNQITEMPWVYQRFYRRRFRSVHFSFEPLNLPPAGIYFCRDLIQ